MNAKRIVFAVLLFAAVPLFAAQDVITIASQTANGNTLDVPIYVRDASTTPLGMDQPAGSKIESFSFKINYSPVSSVQSISIARAGITANLHPSFEATPSTSGTISLIDTFNESTDLIPFTLDAAAPGNLVAHLSITLSSSAPPGSTVSLTFDTATTQLANTGGTAKETIGNGALGLVNGTITVPNVSISLTPTRLNLTPGSKGSIFINASAPMPSMTTLNVISSDTTVATVPSTVVMNAGQQVASVQATAVAIGNARVTVTLPASMGSGSAAATVAVANAQTCNTPNAPQISGPSGAEVNADYSITWAAVSDATEYFVDESTDAAFTNPATTTVPTTSATFNHSTNNVTYYYRVRGHNHAGTCDLVSASSNVVSVLVGHAPPPPPALTHYLAVVGSTAGSNGSYFKTAVQLYNPHSAAVSGKLVFHPQGTSGASGDPSLAYSLAPQKTLAYADLLPAMGVASGLGTVDIVADATSDLPMAVVRVFNDGGVAGTTGLGEDQLSASDALQSGDTGVILAPTDVQHFRLNIGIRTLDQGVAMNIVVRDKDGNTVKTASASYGPTYFTQPGAAGLTGYTFTGGETISFTLTSGSAFIYGSTTDNTTNDPTVQLVKKVQ